MGWMHDEGVREWDATGIVSTLTELGFYDKPADEYRARTMLYLANKRDLSSFDGEKVCNYQKKS